jgi:hypothetical protein
MADALWNPNLAQKDQFCRRKKRPNRVVPPEHAVWRILSAKVGGRKQAQEAQILLIRSRINGCVDALCLNLDISELGLARLMYFFCIHFLLYNDQRGIMVSYFE